MKVKKILCGLSISLLAGASFAIPFEPSKIAIDLVAGTTLAVTNAGPDAVSFNFTPPTNNVEVVNFEGGDFFDDLVVGQMGTWESTTFTKGLYFGDPQLVWSIGTYTFEFLAIAEATYTGATEVVLEGVDPYDTKSFEVIGAGQVTNTNGGQVALGTIRFDGGSEGDFIFFDFSSTTTALELNPVPEPGSIAILSLGLIGLRLARKRQR